MHCLSCNGSALTRCCPPQWENTNNKTSVVLYAVGAVVALWLTTTVVGAVNNVPLVRPHLLLRYGAQTIDLHSGCSGGC
jgi:CAAD domains of cyanobacterial aminoacyl-tRNA synthetase